MRRSVLFVCVHNSARSQMAEAFVNTWCAEDFVADSAGLEPGTLNPLAVSTMAEIGIDISKATTKSVFDRFKTGKQYSFVITVCDESSAEQCPVVPGGARRLHWSFPDPAGVAGSDQEKAEQVRSIRDSIRAQIATWCAEVCAAPVSTHV
jgi:arsenate reductase (thioredoxin)